MPATARRSSGVTTAQVFHALSDDTRIAIIEMLRRGERCVCDLQGVLEAAQSRLSFHLKVLKDAGLVTDRKQGRWSYYTLNAERLVEASEVLNTFATPVPSGASLQLHSLSRASRAGVGSVNREPAAMRNRAGARRDACCD
jgi:ArsR family transcriptional regulator, arsenate/arsenite/antimonite-responsive transcriptional repressor